MLNESEVVYSLFIAVFILVIIAKLTLTLTVTILFILPTSITIYIIFTNTIILYYNNIYTYSQKLLLFLISLTLVPQI